MVMAACICLARNHSDFELADLLKQSRALRESHIARFYFRQTMKERGWEHLIEAVLEE
jgi:hypothetical protein